MESTVEQKPERSRDQGQCARDLHATRPRQLGCCIVDPNEATHAPHNAGPVSAVGLDALAPPEIIAERVNGADEHG